MSAFNDRIEALPCIRVDVVEAGGRLRGDWQRCAIGENLHFTTESLESYFFACWRPAVYDALLVAAAVEFCDRTQRRFSRLWAREVSLRIPVHDPGLWGRADVSEALHDALEFLTGDRWHISFRARTQDLPAPRQGRFSLRGDVQAVIPFSNGVDSCAVAGLTERDLGDKLVRVRLGSRNSRGETRCHVRHPFTAVPYKVRAGAKRFVESSARSRGFKFALISGLAAYIANAGEVIVPESGQGALGPALVPVGQAYIDYRSHPLFTVRMERFLAALLRHNVRYRFPRLWKTKGETLADYVAQCREGRESLQETWSCWQDARHGSVEGKKRQCGICAACMLRRLSFHAAGLREPKETYVWERLDATEFSSGTALAFDRKKVTAAMLEYAIAGTLHMDHLASLSRSPAAKSVLELNAFQLGRSCDLTHVEADSRVRRLLAQHEAEWKSFLGMLGPDSFVAAWSASAS